MSDVNNQISPNSISAQELPAKRKYEAPALSDVGSIAALTRSVTPNAAGDGNGMRPCL